MADKYPPNRDYFDELFNQLANEPYREYWHALGKFVHTFSLAENRLLALLRDIAGLNNEIGGIIFSGTRIDAAKDCLNRILEATGQIERKERLARFLAQFSAIATIRNNITHWGADLVPPGGLVPPDLFRVSNAKLRPTKEKLKEFFISPADINDMIADLERINVAILYDHVGKRMGETGDEDALGRYLLGPWLYTPPQPSPPSNPRPQGPRSPPHQRDASRESRRSKKKKE